ncbi:assimilatory sulfite reductase (NADPH) flavoprotein subunit [Hymenobacter sp. BT186]|uniref:assimilatory sulfite reductase (NADPH) n=1 Tax=Hymenobacter telluris TaxID=2816474 RepID=A0A939JBT8_9BACT|nr:assimilatory sulfite reductase (NADPH) flavoprotein subunit [Hymenobacter telluris]MBO0356607.1 assimilatory sulfite reductase (NADPH) flavoprotein subunit [Hymenobacter telluris]MBW3372632.1 assimilatory sulfite reductase (NADPH) flavoprotein subunit [Hymenobacter norwichensis]
MSISSSSGLPLGLDDQALNNLTSNLNSQQLVWLSGYLYGRAADATQGSAVAALTQQAAAPAPAAATPAATPAAPARLTILYGSQTGNSKKVALQTAEAARQRGLEPTVRDMNEYPTRALASEQQLLVITSTQGEGEPPIAAEDLHKFLLGPRAPKLPALRYSVLALGDKSYVQFCQTGIEFDERLAALGAQRLTERVDCDVAYQESAAQWAERVLDVLAQEAETAAPQTGPSTGATLAQAAASGSNGGSQADLSAFRVAPAATPAVQHEETPIEATLLEKIQLNGRGSAKETYHLEFSLEGSGLHYEPGDALMVQPHNRPELVADVLQAGRFDSLTPVQFKDEELDLNTALTERLELSVLTRDVLERYAALAPQHPALHEALAGTPQLQAFLYGRDVVDLLTQFPADVSAQQLATVLRPLPARAYSIASSLSTYPDEVHLTVSAVRYETNGRQKHGACSVYQADHLNIGDTARVWVDRNEYFKLPQTPATDIIMVGPGTGVAPFRAFVQERAETGATGRNWLVFGNPEFTTDFLYQTEWQQHLKQGTLHRLDLAFSRDQAEKIYVQHRLLEQAPQVFKWLEDGAHFYVCGDKTRMAADVRKALLTIIQQQSGQDSEYATEYLKQLKKQRRYLEDVY